MWHPAHLLSLSSLWLFLLGPGCGPADQEPETFVGPPAESPAAPGISSSRAPRGFIAQGPGHDLPLPDVRPLLHDPPPLAGGTLLVVGSRAALADPDLDRVYLVDLDARRILQTVDLMDGDEPGRLIQDRDG